MADQRRLVTLALAVLVAHTSVTVLEERLFSIDSFKAHSGGAFMTLFMYTVTAMAYYPKLRYSQAGFGLPSEGARRLLLTVSLLYVGTTTLTKTSLRYIDMPTQTVLKSAKLLPVMAGSMLILGKSYGLYEWLAALMLVSGICIFNLSTHFPEANHTAAGAICIVIALGCDALLGNYQQKVLGSGVNPDQLMFMQSAFGSVFMLLVTACDGTLFPGLHLLTHDVAVCSTLIAWALCITVGTAVILQLVSEFSAVTAIVVTTARKALTLLASFVLFPKHIGIGHPIGAALVFGSAFVAQRKKKKQPKGRDEELPVAVSWPARASSHAVGGAGGGGHKRPTGASSGGGSCHNV